jgi:hypothetical protein
MLYAHFAITRPITHVEGRNLYTHSKNKLLVGKGYFEHKILLTVILNVRRFIQLVSFLFKNASLHRY